MATASPDTPFTLSLSRILAVGALAAPLVAAAIAWATLLGNVAEAQKTADRAEISATRAESSLHAIDVRLERIQTVVERLDRDK